MNKIINDPDTIEEVMSSFSRTTDEIITLEEFRKLLLSGKKLRMKYGVDVTSAHMHIGHAVNLWMYRRLQELGHKVIFLTGDFTTQIGDPTGKNKTRPVIPEEEIQKNAKAFIDQAMMVLHNDPEVVEIRKNSEWFDLMKAGEFLNLLKLVTHDRLISRDMFRKRMEEGKEIYMHEMTYPLIQGYDSVALEADLTIIGSDQLYNEMMGRFYQEKFGRKPQVIITTKITPGICGREKQSKSLGNYVGLGHSPGEKFGRIMSIPDNLILQYFEVYTDITDTDIEEIKEEIIKDPMKCKLKLAETIVARYHGKEIAGKESDRFLNTFSRKQVPEDIPVVSIRCASLKAFEIVRKCLPEEKFSNSEIRRLFSQGAVKIDGNAVEDINKEIALQEGIILKVGKRMWFKVTF